MKKRKKRVKVLFEKYIKKVDRIKNLNGGLSNDLFLINGNFVWRVFLNKLLDHKNEIAVMKELDYFSILYKDNKNICYKFIKGEIIDNISFKLKIREVLKEIRKVHKIKIKTPHIWYDLTPKWLDQIQKIEIRNFLKLELEKINNRLLELNTRKDNVFCHNDIIPSNVLFNKRKCFIIDWEFSGVNFYFHELGNLICEYHIDYEKQEYNFDSINLGLIKKVIKYYDKEDKSQIENKIEKMKLGIQMSHLFWAIYSFAKLEKTNDSGFDYLKFAESRINQLLKKDITFQI